MDNERVILHSDMNSFYASVEMMLNPELKGKPVAVCGSTEERHGIVLAKSDLAKKAGVKTGMVNWEARQLCPGLVVVPPQYDQYLKYSKLARQIYHRYTDLVEPYGMDECWLDVTGSGVCGTGMEIAEAIRRTTKEELGLTVSIGVSFNKIFAKLGSDMRKPDAITEIKRDNFKEKIWPLDAAELLYVGKATENKLAQYGIHTIGDLAKTSPDGQEMVPSASCGAVSADWTTARNIAAIPPPLWRTSCRKPSFERSTSSTSRITPPIRHS